MNKNDVSIDSKTLESILKKVTLVDVREPEETQEGIIPGAVLIPLGDIPFRGPQDLKKDDAIVLYCAHGVRSMHALMALKKAGFQNLKSLDGGICAWDEYQESKSRS